MGRTSKRQREIDIYRDRLGGRELLMLLLLPLLLLLLLLPMLLLLLREKCSRSRELYRFGPSDLHESLIYLAVADKHFY